MCFQICVIQTVQCHTVSMSGVKSITTRVRNDLPYSCAIFLCFICWDSIILHDFILESSNETLFQRLNLFWMFLCNCLDNAITFINRESSIVQRVHSLLLIQNETLWKFFCLQNLIKSRDAVRKVLSVFEFWIHWLKRRTNSCDECRQLRYISRLILHGFSGCRCLFNLINSHCIAVCVNVPNCLIIFNQFHQLIHGMMLQTNTLVNKVNQQNNINLQNIVFQELVVFSDCTVNYGGHILFLSSFALAFDQTDFLTNAAII